MIITGLLNVELGHKTFDERAADGPVATRLAFAHRDVAEAEREVLRKVQLVFEIAIAWAFGRYRCSMCSEPLVKTECVTGAKHISRETVRVMSTPTFPIFQSVDFII